MNKIKNIILIGSLMFSKLALAGGWTSGGGELIRDAHNPWFLSNTKEVKYCIKINEKEFGQSKSFVRQQIFQALTFWKEQLRELSYTNFANVNFEFRLGTQNFYEVNCNQNPDISFQFAYLDQEQKDRMGDLSKTIAVSVRTDYDLVNLKAKGFVYFNKDDQFPQKPWSNVNGEKILPVLVHEVGHIFGIQHTEDIFLMKESFPEEVVDRDFNGPHIGYDFSDLHIFIYKPGKLFQRLCIGEENSITIPKPITINAKYKSIKDRFFGVPEGYSCQVSYVQGLTFKFESSKNQVPFLIGEAQLKMQDLSDIGSSMFKAVNVVSFWVPVEQKVFTSNTQIISAKIPVAHFQPKQYFKGTYQTLDGKIKRPISLEVSNYGSISKISGYMDKEIIVDLESESGF